MAVVKFGTTVVGLRGTVGGVTYSAGKSSSYAKQWAQGSNPRTSIQQKNRAALTRCGAAWWALGSTLRADWDAFGLVAPEVIKNRLGEVIHLTGWQWFVKVNQRLFGVGLSLRSAVPSTAVVAAATGFFLTLGQLPGGVCAVQWGAGSIPLMSSGVLWAALNTSGGAQVSGVPWVRVWSAHEPAGTSAVITTEMGLRYGSIRTGWQFFGQLYVLRDDGIRSVAAVTSTVVV